MRLNNHPYRLAAPDHDEAQRKTVAMIVKKLAAGRRVTPTEINAYARGAAGR